MLQLKETSLPRTLYRNCSDRRHKAVHLVSLNVSLCAPTSNKCVSELSFKPEKQHLKSTPTLGSSPRTVSKRDSEKRQLLL
ncbi:hypothetical protein PBY51_016873 [Eleginops maclovinus]|uniref:Uncharacterized protein n=1 Tax=Eleginops maclovinus TaxID=56733 RepID=A0AAN7WRN5_ELEMC|nr:hypothetical protein PBY51_016873 [Eleginops maclovinus]